MTTDTGYIQISKDANAKMIALVFYGTFTLLALLALPFPFFRHVFTFASLVGTGFAIFISYSAYEDKKNKAKKNRPTNVFNPPAWFKPVFYISMIGISAGLRLGFYIVPIAWIITWAAMESMKMHMDACYNMKDDNDTWAPKEGLDPCHPDYGKETTSVKN